MIYLVLVFLSCLPFQSCIFLCPSSSVNVGSRALLYSDVIMSGLVFAASSASAIVFDIGLLKSDVSAPKTCLTRPGTTCATWSTEGDVFIGSSNGTVDRLDCKGTTIGTVFAESGSVVALAMKDKRSLIIALSQSVHLIDVTEPAGNGSLLVSVSTIIFALSLRLIITFYIDKQCYQIDWSFIRQGTARYHNRKWHTNL